MGAIQGSTERLGLRVKARRMGTGGVGGSSFTLSPPVSSGNASGQTGRIARRIVRQSRSAQTPPKMPPVSTDPQMVLSEAIHEMVRHVMQTQDVDETLGLLTAAAVDTIPGVHLASISHRLNGKPIQTLAPTHPLAVAIDELQYDLEEGPCFDVAMEERVALSNDLAHEARWPRFGPAGCRSRIHAQLAVVLISGKQERASLNLYARRPNAFADLELAELFVGQAALVVALARTIAQLDQASRSRTVGRSGGRDRDGATQPRPGRGLRASCANLAGLEHKATRCCQPGAGLTTARTVEERVSE